jgi:myosin heavy subunit
MNRSATVRSLSPMKSLGILAINVDASKTKKFRGSRSKSPTSLKEISRQNEKISRDNESLERILKEKPKKTRKYSKSPSEERKLSNVLKEIRVDKQNFTEEQSGSPPLIKKIPAKLEKLLNKHSKTPITSSDGDQERMVYYFRHRIASLLNGIGRKLYYMSPEQLQKQPKHSWNAEIVTK